MPEKSAAILDLGTSAIKPMMQYALKRAIVFNGQTITVWWEDIGLYLEKLSRE